MKESTTDHSGRTKKIAPRFEVRSDLFKQPVDADIESHRRLLQSCISKDREVQNGMSSSEKSSIGGGLLAAGAWR